VAIDFMSNGVPQEQTWNTTTTGMRVPMGLWGLADQPGRRYTWRVTVVQPTTDGKGGERLIPLSQPSASRTFTWQ
jgi:hypothetical protein